MTEPVYPEIHRVTCTLIGCLSILSSGVAFAAGGDIAPHPFAPSSAPASTTSSATSSSAAEIIDVQGQAMVPLSRRYRGLERILRRFESFPAEDRDGLTLHMQAVLQPGDRPGHESGLMMKPDGAIIPLVHGAESEIVLPRDTRLWDADPPLYARLSKDEHVSVGFFFTVVPPDASGFSRKEALHWLNQLDRCIEDEGGVVLAFLLPDTHKLTVDIAAGSRFEAVEGERRQLLVDNGGASAYRFTFRPQDFPKNTHFVASKPLMRIAMALPFPLHGALSPK